ncbi:MAG: hypothetical protein M3Y60_05520, partial [Bacteroidota bacterium]|nr:hypothetical protein [Bacteroidota bacterium]
MENSRREIVGPAQLCVGACAIAVILLTSCAPPENKEVSDVGQGPVFRKILSSHSGVTFRNVVAENIENYFDNFAYVYN